MYHFHAALNKTLSFFTLFQINTLNQRAKQRNALEQRQIYFKVWTGQRIHAKIFINLPAAIGQKNIQSNNIFFYFSFILKQLFCRPDSLSSYDWFNEKQSKVLRKIRSFLQSNITSNEPHSVSQTKIMYRACMNTG